jgi:choline dehydrogenase-like flavoprotein
VTTPERPWDVVIVGSGATGAWAAKDLGERGLRVLVLEAGPNVSLDHAVGSLLHARDEAWTTRARRWANKHRQRVQRRHRVYTRANPVLFVDDDRHPYTTPAERPFVWIRGRQIGGRTLTWNGILVRTSDHDLQAPQRDGFGAEWPIAYADLAPHYAAVERFLGVRGTKEGLDALPDGEFLAPTEMTPPEQRFKRVVEARWPERHVIPSRGIDRNAQTLVEGCAFPGFTAQGSSLAAALATGNVTVRPNAIVTRVLVDDATGRATGVRYVDRLTHAETLIEARAIAVCGSTIETARLLLASACPKHPDGLANSSGQVGRNLMDHAFVQLMAALPEPGDAPPVFFDGAHAIFVPRFMNLENPRAEGFLRGYGVWGGINRGGHDTRIGRGEVATPLVAFGEMLPREDNRVTLHPDRRDEWGMPIPHIDCKWSDNELAMMAHMRATLHELVGAMDGRILVESKISPPGSFIHEVGTARMGSDPRRSVLNPHLQAWDSPSLFVLDGSAWVTSLWQNPTLTMMALAARGCEHLARELAAGHL